MKIGLDIHGVISDAPDFLLELATLVVSAGGEIHILTGSPIKKAILELKSFGFENGISYTHIYSIMDFLDESELEPIGHNDKYGNLNIYADDDWDRCKGDYCREHNIDLHLDDSLLYEKYFTTGFARFFTNTNTPKPSHKPKRLID